MPEQPRFKGLYDAHNKRGPNFVPYEDTQSLDRETQDYADRHLEDPGTVGAKVVPQKKREI